MFLHKVKKNWKKHRRLKEIILDVTITRICVEIGLGVVPMDCLSTLKFALGTLAVAVAMAFLEPLLDLGTAYCKKLCRFALAVLEFSRDYWSSKKLAA